MKNLARSQEADLHIQEELLLAGIPLTRGEKSTGEVPYSITGTSGDWTFARVWNYWIASAQEGKGLPLEVAAQMHERAYPLIGENVPKTYGQVIRVAGHCGSPHPREWTTEYDSLDRLLQYDPKGENERFVKKALSEGTFTQENANRWHFVRTKKELIEATTKSLVDLYHVDTQLGLNELARVIKG